MRYRRVPGLRTGARLIGLGTVAGALFGIVVGAIVFGDDEYWSELAIFALTVVGTVSGVLVGLCIWLVSLWRARAPLALPATIGAVGGLTACVALGLTGRGDIGWMMFLGVAVAAPCAFVSASVSVLARRYARP